MQGNTPGFSPQYHQSLIKISEKLVSFNRALSADVFFTTKILTGIAPDQVGEFVPYCILSDFCKILKYLHPADDNKAELEMFGLIFLSPNLLNKLQIDFLSFTYESLSNAYVEGTYKPIGVILEGLCNADSPLKVKVTANTNVEIKADNDMRSTLSLINALELNNHPLLGDCAALLYDFAKVIAGATNEISPEDDKVINDFYSKLHMAPQEKSNASSAPDAQNTTTANSTENLNDVISELENLIGLDGVKQEVHTLINYVKVQKEREKMGLKNSQVSYHCVFTGSPGTGKTTVARIVAKIYRYLGVLAKGQLIETDRSGLIAEYAGQTAVKVNKVIDSALDGILFIDEAYSLVGDNQDDFGREAVATLIKRMEDDRERLILILAGYSVEMKTFIDTNPGFKSRVNNYIDFVDYNEKDLMSIFKLQCKNADYKLTDDAEKMLADVMTNAVLNKDKSFGNARYVRNIFEKAVEMQANRIGNIQELSKDILTTLTVEDIPKSL